MGKKKPILQKLNKIDITKLREKFYTYKIEVREYGQLEKYRNISARMILLSSSFICYNDGEIEDYKGFFPSYLDKLFDKEVIDEEHTSPEAEYYIHIYNKEKLIIILPKY